MGGPALKWWNLHTRAFFGPGPDGAEGGSEAPAAPSGGGDGASGAPPASTPSPSSDPVPSSAPDRKEFDWSALGSADDLDYHVEVAAAPDVTSAPPTPAEPPKEPAKPVPPPQPQPAPAQDPTTPPATAAQPSAQSAGAVQPLSAAEPWRIAEGLEANRDAVIAHLASAKFALSEEDIRDLDTDVNVAIPKIMARVFLESQVSMQKFLAQAVPGMVKQYNTVTSANKSAEDAFFAAHKALDVNNPQHRATAVRIATVYRQANPDIPLNQLIAEVGPMVMAALRVNAPPQAQPGVSAAPVGRSRSPQGFVPAVNGGGGVSPTPDAGNPWDGLGRNFDDGA